MKAKSQKEKSCCLVLRGNNPLFKKTEHKYTSVRTNDKRNTSKEYASQKMTKSNCSSCGNKAKSSCGCLPCHLEREEKEAFPYLPKEIAEELKREHEYLKNTGYNEDDFREHLEKEEYLFEEYLPKHLQEKMEQEHSQLASHSNNYIKDVLESWPAAKLNQKLRECVYTLLEQYLKKCGIKTEILNQINTRMTYGLAGTPYAGGHEEVSTAAILYPNVGNQVFENGEWTELERIRIILDKDIMQELLQKEYVQPNTSFTFTSAVVSLLHELMHAFLYQTICPGVEIAFYENSANEVLVRALVQVILTRMHLAEIEQLKVFSNRDSKHSHFKEKLIEAKTYLKEAVQIAKEKGGTQCLDLLLNNSNKYSSPLFQNNSLSLLKKKTNLNPSQNLKNFSHNPLFLKNQHSSKSKNRISHFSSDTSSKTLQGAFKKLVDEMYKWGMRPDLFAEIVDNPETLFMELENEGGDYFIAFDKADEGIGVPSEWFSPFGEGLYMSSFSLENELEFSFCVSSKIADKLKSGVFYEDSKISKFATVAINILVDAVFTSKCVECDNEIGFDATKKAITGIFSIFSDVFHASEEEKPSIKWSLNLQIKLAMGNPEGIKFTELLNIKEVEGAHFLIPSIG